MSELNKYEKAIITKKLKYGEDFFKVSGAKGGKAKVPKGFASNPKLASAVSRGRHKKGK